MTDHNDFRSFCNADKIGEDIELRFKQPLMLPPPPEAPDGSQPIMSFGDRGKLLNVFNDGVLIRSDKAERFYAWSQLFLVEFETRIALA